MATGQQDDHNRYNKTHVQHFPDGVEKPPVTVDLLLVLRLEDEYNLNWNKIVRIVSVRLDKRHRWVNGQLSRVLDQM